MSRIHRRRKAAPGNIYMHFAVITLVVTGLLAVFAEGENAKPASVAVAETAPPDEDAITKAAKGENANEIKVRDGALSPSFADDFGNAAGAVRTHSFGESAMGAARGVVSGIAGMARAPNVVGQLPPGMSAEEWLALNARREQARAPEMGSEAQIEDLMAQSRMRSGQASE